MKELIIDKELKEIVLLISEEKKSVTQCSEIESDDMFQSQHYCGGFDADEEEFCFSYYDEDNVEYWFQLSLEQIEQIRGNSITHIQIEESEL